jgi:hypothetical protein
MVGKNRFFLKKNSPVVFSFRIFSPTPKNCGAAVHGWKKHGFIFKEVSPLAISDAGRTGDVLTVVR